MSSALRPIVAGRYELGDEIGSGGMATVHLGRVRGEGGFTRPVAIKRLHPHLARDPAFVAAFMEEASLAAGISHPNVVATLDVVSAEGELLLVMEYVAGASLANLLHRAPTRVSPPVLSGVMAGALAGLHAIHEAADAAGRPLGLVHRDVSPQNIIVGRDGRARVLDFGVAKATGRRARERTRTGIIKGKLGYMAPEQFDGKVSRCSDLYAASVVLWEGLTGARLFDGDTDGEIIHRILAAKIDPPSARTPGIAPELDAHVLKGLSMDPRARFQTAEEMAAALIAVVQPATALSVAAWVGEAATSSRASRRLGDSLSSAPPAGATLAPEEPSVTTETDIPQGRARPRRRDAWLAVTGAGFAVAIACATLVTRIPRGTAKATEPATAALEETLAPLPSAAPLAAQVHAAPATPAVESVDRPAPALAPHAILSPRVDHRRTPAGHPSTTAHPSGSPAPSSQGVRILDVLNTRE